MYKIIKKVNENIFRGYDIRGICGVDLNADIFYTLGRAYAHFLNQRRIQEAIIGRDNRQTSEEYSKAFIFGLNSGGICTVDIGMSLSQIVYLGCYEFKTKGCAIITASHNSKEFNGLKLGVGYSDTMLTEEIDQIRDLVKTGQYSEGHGVNRYFDIFEIYKKEILKYFTFKKKWKIVVDCSCTTSGKFYPDIFREAGFEVFEQNCELNSDFPVGTPDPTALHVLKRLSEGVLKNKAEIGFSYDTDGDRMSVVDENGCTLWMDTIVSLFALDILEFIPNAPIVYNALCSKQVTETIQKAGGRPIIWKTGHSFIKAKIREIRAPFGGELSGHIFFADNFFGHDDGAFASLRLLKFLERRDMTLGEAVKRLPIYISSPEIKLGLSDEIKCKIINEHIKNDFFHQWPNADFTEIDGIRMETEDSMAIIRASHNGPYITIKFESKNSDKYKNIKKIIFNMLKKYKEIDWSQGVNTDIFYS